VAVITSDSDLIGISFNLTEDGDTGIFTNSFSLSDGPSSNESKNLHAEDNNIITATVGDATGSASILPVEINFNNNFEEYDYGDTAHLTVTDQAANTNPSVSETVSVTVTSSVNLSGTTLTLTETGPDTGVFGFSDDGDDNNLIFMTSNNLVPISNSITVSACDPDSNDNPTEKNSVNATITTTSDPEGIELLLSETDVNSGFFEGILNWSTLGSDSGTGIILAAEGDFFTLTDPSGEFSTKGMIVPNSNPSNGAITVNGPSNGESCITGSGGASGIITAIYQSSSDSASIIDQGASGGGGGGLVRPSLVVNALAGISGGGSAYSSPTLQLSNLVKLGQLDVPSEVEQMIYDHDSTIPAPAMELGLFENFDYPMIINDNGFVLSGYSTTLETQNLEINTPHTIKLMYYEADKIQHFSLYTNLRDANTAIHQSDTQLIYNDGQELNVVDPNEFFQDVSFSINEIDDLKKELVLEITFANEMDTSDIILRSWDPYLNSFDTYILDAITVVSDEIIESPITTYEEPIIEELQSQSIPIWIKNNAAWWSEQQISDADFVAGIEYLISNGIIIVPGVEVGESIIEIPDWIKNNAGWWSESLITDEDFTEAMQWLVSNGVIQI
jgi:hypothetical protein